MYRFAVTTLAVCALAVGASAMTAEEYGMTMSVNAYDAVCWYENLKNFPNTRTNEFTKCSGQAKSQKDQVMKGKFFVDHPAQRQEYFGKWIDQKVLERLPSEYKSKCEKFLLDPTSAPSANESDALNDGGYEYPFKGFSYCLLHTLREAHGEKAIDAVKNERTHYIQHWMKTILDRENEFRTRHSVEPLLLIKDLDDAAQQWAETNARECKMRHSDKDDAGRKYQGTGTGESLFAGSGTDDKMVAAYQAANGWYEEIKDYPYPTGYKGNNKDELFHKIGHFTQSVWKGTKYVGYGYAYNPNCAPGFTRYITARYYPAGNMIGSFVSNVNQPNNL